MVNVLAVNPGHHGSVAVVSDGEVRLYVEEERLSRYKYDGNPFRSLLEAVGRFRIDDLVLCGLNPHSPQLTWPTEDPFYALIRKFDNGRGTTAEDGTHRGVRIINAASQHHLGHAAAAFYNSGFETAAAVIVDGAGFKQSYPLTQDPNGPRVEGYETESIYQCAYPAQFTPIYKAHSDNTGFLFENESLRFDSSVTITKAYEAVTEYLGFGGFEAGKTMGLAPYGEADPSLPELFIDGYGNKNVFVLTYPEAAVVDQLRHPALKLTADPKVWHRDPSRIPQVAKNLAWKVQQDTQKLVADLIEKAAQRTGEKNIVLAGGYALNCVANYSYLQRFPHLNFYIDPIAHDGGTALGFALYQWHVHEQETNKTRRWTGYKRDRIAHLYLGPDDDDRYRSLEALPDFQITDATDAQAAALLAQGEIVGFYNGRSEGGPRALGNRSLLFDPRVPDGKQIVNRVKGREWFRPFAGSVLYEEAGDWFDLRTLEESPFMMYAVDVLESKREQIPAITHVDGTCRIQTVKREQNPRYYALISAFFEATGCPIVFNTSFNLAGDPLAETLEDALDAMRRSDLRYLYLPEINKLLTKMTSQSVSQRSESDG